MKKRVLSTFLSFSILFSMFVGTGLTARADSTSGTEVITSIKNGVGQLTHLLFDQGNMYIADYEKSKVYEVLQSDIGGSYNITKTWTMSTGAHPQGLAADRAGNVYVASETYGTISKLSATDNSVSIFFNLNTLPDSDSSTGTYGLAVIGDDLYVSNRQTGYIFKISLTGQPEGSLFAKLPLGNGSSLTGAWNIIGYQGRYLYVTVPFADAIYQLDTQATYSDASTYTPYATLAGCLPTGLAVDDNGNLFVGSRESNDSSIYEVMTNGDQVRVGNPLVNGSIIDPEGMAIAPDKSMYIADYLSKRVVRFVTGTITANYYIKNTTTKLSDSDTYTGFEGTAFTPKAFSEYTLDSNSTGTDVSFSNTLQTIDYYYTANRYNISYNLYGGTNNASNPAAYSYGTGVSLADPKKDGFIFEGWFADAGFTTKVTAISATDTGTKTVYAKWKPCIVIGTQPKSTTIAMIGDTLTLGVSATANDGGTLSYQWYSNTTDSTTGASAIENATASSYTPPTSTEGTTYYYCVVTDTPVSGEAATLTTATAMVTVSAKIRIGTQPKSSTDAFIGDAVTLSVGATANDGGTLSYQWYSNTTDSTTGASAVDDATASSYTAPTSTEGTTYYYCVVTDTPASGAAATLTTATAKVTVAAKISIGTQPKSTSATVGGTVTLSVNATANDGGTLSYQWYSNTSDSTTGASAIVDATASSYTAPTQAAGTTYYYCVVTDTPAVGEAVTLTTATARVTVTALALPDDKKDVTIKGNGGSAQGAQEANITPADTNTATVANVIVKIGDVTLTASSGVLNGALGGDSSGWLKLSQQATSPAVQSSLTAVATAAGITPVTALDVDLTRYYSNGTSEAVHQLNDHVSVEIKLTDAQIAAISDASKAHLLYFDPKTSKFTDMGGTFDLAKKTVTFKTNHLSSFVIAQDSGIGVTYNSHVRNKGWLPSVNNGAQSGTTGNSLRLEAVHIKLTGVLPADASIIYQAHVENKGWMTPVSNGTIAGTTGNSLRAEAFRITLSGLSGYAVKYRVHVRGKGWLDWQTTENGTDVKKAAVAGTTGESRRVEAIEISIVKLPS